jgi:hypothetical protein
MDQNDHVLIKILSGLVQDWEFAPALIEAIESGAVSPADKERLASVLMDASMASNVARKEVEMAIALEIASSAKRVEKEEMDTIESEMFKRLEIL